MGRIIWRDAYMDLISNHHADSVHFHSAGKTSRGGDITVPENLHDFTAQRFDDLTL
jgi:hypothetical protein